jgi:uncharacterized protein YkwD
MATRILALIACTLSLALATSADAQADPLMAPQGHCADENSTTASHADLRLSMRCLINYAREQVGQDSLPYTATLDRSADLKSYGLRRRCGDDFSHRPCGTSFRSAFTSAGYPASAAIGENLAWCPGACGRPCRIMLSWLESPGHRENLLRERWEDQAYGFRARVRGWATTTPWCGCRTSVAGS